MTDFNYCCLCASDEGVFLDIFTATHRQLEKRSFLEEFETCLSVKVEEQDETLSSKICHRCAIELGQCNKFVEKYREVNEAIVGSKEILLKKCCCLCLSPVENRYLFTLAKDFRSKINPLQKIYECFDKQITREEAEYRSICLLCRYNLDVLYDLKKLAREVKPKLQRIVESKYILANLPKTETFVVNRKTTVVYKSSLELRIDSNSDSEQDTMARRGSRSKKLEKINSPVVAKLRTCGQCQTSIEGGIDMYRLHSTGITVCKMCWITMDPFKTNRTDKRKRQNQAEGKNIRMCAVFLRDVLSPASSKDNDSYKVEKDQKGNTVYVITDDSSESKEKQDVKSKKNLRNQSGSLGKSRSGEESDISLRLRRKRSLNQEDGYGNGKSNKKLKLIKNEATVVATESRARTRYQNSDSDSVDSKSKQGNATDVKKEAANKAKNASKVNNVDSADKSSKIKSNENDGKLKGVDAEIVQSKSEDSSSSSNHGVRRKLRKVRNKVPLNLKPELLDSPKIQKNLKHTESRTPTTRTNSNIQSIAKSEPSKMKRSTKRSKTLMMVSFPFKLKDPYECKVCRTEYRNKVLGMKHELTHFKQVEIKIEKLNNTHHFQTSNQNSTTSELPDASCSLSLPATHEKSPQLELPTSTSPSESDEDKGKKPNFETKEGASVEQPKKSKSTQQDDKSVDVDDAKQTNIVSSSIEPPTGESTLVINDSKNETPKNISLKLDSVTGTGGKKIDTLSSEADSVTETNVISSNGVENILNKTVDKNKTEELSEKLNNTTDDIESKNNSENKNDEHVVSPSSKATGIDVEADRDSSEEMESDVDIRIVDTGSSTEDGSDRTEKLKADSNTVNNVSLPKDTDDKALKTKEKTEKTDITTEKIDVEDDTIATVEFNTVSSKNEQKIQAKGETSDFHDLDEKIEEDVRPSSVVTEILQEVIDLATAEVQKRGESDGVTVDETLENISQEIKNTAEKTSVADEILSNIDAKINKATDSDTPDSNSTGDLSKNNIDASTS